jgi:hypothetical protein
MFRARVFEGTTVVVFGPGLVGLGAIAASRLMGAERIIDRYLAGDIDVDSLISHRLTLGDVNKGFDLMHAPEGRPHGHPFRLTPRAWRAHLAHTRRDLGLASPASTPAMIEWTVLQAPRQPALPPLGAGLAQAHLVSDPSRRRRPPTCDPNTGSPHDL